jgi:hypothetical protein
MRISLLLTTTAVGLVLALAPASAQMKGPDEKTAPRESAAPKEKAPAEKMSEPKEKGSAPGELRKGAESTPKGTEPAEKRAEPKDKGMKGAAEKAPDRKDSTPKGAEKAPEPKEKATKGAGAEPKDKGAAGKVQLTEEKRTNIGQSLSRETNLNRANNVRVTVNIGTRLPRSVRLVALPAAIVAIVPEYRSYRYVVVEDRICIVEPATYEIVEVIPLSGRVAGGGGHSATLMLTEEERAVILSEVDMTDGSTLGLGAFSEGSDVPRDVRLRPFSGVIVERVPKVKGYKFFTAENRIAIVDPDGAKVQLVLERRR